MARSVAREHAIATAIARLDVPYGSTAVTWRDGIRRMVERVHPELF